MYSSPTNYNQIEDVIQKIISFIIFKFCTTISYFLIEMKTLELFINLNTKVYKLLQKDKLISFSKFKNEVVSKILIICGPNVI